jgi:hypothetical protein
MRGIEIGLVNAKDICNRDWPIDWTVAFSVASACVCASVEGWSAARVASLLRKFWIAAAKLLATKLRPGGKHQLSHRAKPQRERLFFAMAADAVPHRLTCWVEPTPVPSAASAKRVESDKLMSRPAPEDKRVGPILSFNPSDVREPDDVKYQRRFIKC